MFGSANRLPAARPREIFDTLPVSANLSPGRMPALVGLLAGCVLIAGAWAFRQNFGGIGVGAVGKAGQDCRGRPRARRKARR